jgi:hypothetical protein
VERDYCLINQPEVLDQPPLIGLLLNPQDRSALMDGTFSQEPLFFKSLDNGNQALSDLQILHRHYFW